MRSALFRSCAYGVSLWLMGGSVSCVFAEEGFLKEKSKFSTNRPNATHYERNEHLQDTLELLSADCTEVKVSGSSAKEDVLVIYNAKHEAIKKISGSLLNESISVFDNKVFVEFTSNSYVSDKGFEVTLIEKNIDSCLPELKKKFIEAARNILYYGTGSLGDSIDSTQIHLNELHTSLKQTKSFESLLPEISKNFKELAIYYQQVSSKTVDIQTTLSARLKELEKLQGNIADIIERLGKAHAEYMGIIEHDQLLIPQANTTQVQQKLQISAEAYKKLAANAQSKKKVWEHLHQLQHEVIKPVQSYIDGVQIVLYFIGSNASVYQQAASLTVLRTERLVGFNTNLDELKQAVSTLEQQEKSLTDALKTLERDNEATDKAG